MGSNCSSSHKDDDSSSRKSQESPSYQLSTKDGDGKEGDYGGDTKSSVKAGVVLSVAPNPPELTPQPVPSISESLTSASPARKPKEPEPVQPPPARPAVLDLPAVKDAKIVIYICAADSQDCRVEKSLLHNEVYPPLREKCRSRGFECHIVDLHWSIQDRTAEPAELCLQELARQTDNSYLIPVVFLNHFLGTPLLPKTLENADFQTVTSEERSGLLLKWYRLDSTAQPPCYTLQPPVTHIPDLKSSDKDIRERALQQWRKEVDSILTVMLSAFSQELRDTYLSTVVEQEVQHTVLMSRELAKRCLWISRGGKAPDPPSAPGDQELRRRLEAVQKTLKGELSESHMIHVVPAATPDHSEQPEYIQQVTAAVSKQLDAIIESIFEEHENKVDQLRMASELDLRVVNEVIAHARVALRCSQSSVSRQAPMEKALSDNGDGVLVLHGPQGSGKTTLLCKLMHQLEAEAEVVLRLVGLTAASSTLVQVLRSITDQLNPSKTPRPHNLKAYTAIFNESLTEASSRGKTVIIIDGIDQFRDFGENGVSWVPAILPPNVKLVLGTSDGQVCENLKNHLNGTNAKFIPILDLSKKEMETILLHNILEYNHSVNPIVKDCISNSVDSPPLPLYVKVVAWQSTWCNEYNLNLELKSDVKQQVNTMLDQLESIFGKEQIEKALSLLVYSKWGLQDSEMLDILASDTLFHTSNTYLPWAGACLFLSKFTRHLGPFLQYGDHKTLNLRDSAVVEVCLQRYEKRRGWACHTLRDYFSGNIRKNGRVEVKARTADQSDKLGDTYNVRKFEELPYLVLRTDGTALNLTLDHEWILNKLCATDAYQVIEDAYMENTTDDITWLMNFLSDNAESLTYDGHQFYSQVYRYVKNHNCTTLANVWKRLAADPPLNSLLEADFQVIAEEEEKPETNQSEGFNIVRRLPNTNNYVVSVRTNIGEISIWDVAKVVPPLTQLTATYRQFAVGKFGLIKLVVLYMIESSLEIKGDAYEAPLRDSLQVISNLKPPFFHLNNTSVTNPAVEWAGPKITKDAVDNEVAEMKFRCKRVRRLTGLTQPASIEMVDNYKCVVLCNRELHTYDLDKGVILTKLKGVMNQKMPFFGLHDSNHLVALSRNRMYVNLMNLDTGDCVTTFKAGEDRFLNSLLVSSDGKTLVCGDETQKPFPLLVWNLASRKLLYDLRIPQHEFLSRLSAITPQGNYVCCVAKEVVDNTPNYIVVYDLQSGTLFKKWKPAVCTTAIDISHTESCLVSGHLSAKILSWSLGTGNCRYSLSGHSAPVDYLRLSPNGKMCLSMNKEGRDRSIRIWDIAKGSLISVFTPDSPVMACELTDTWVILSTQDNPTLVCLEIRGPDFPSIPVDEKYGSPEES